MRSSSRHDNYIISTSSVKQVTGNLQKQDKLAGTQTTAKMATSGQWREYPWWRWGWQHQGLDWRKQSGWTRGPRQRRGGWRARVMQRISGGQRWSRIDRWPTWSWKEGGTQQNQRAQPEESKSEPKGWGSTAELMDCGPRWRWASWKPWWCWWVNRQRPGLRGWR